MSKVSLQDAKHTYLDHDPETLPPGQYLGHCGRLRNLSRMCANATLRDTPHNLHREPDMTFRTLLTLLEDAHWNRYATSPGYPWQRWIWEPWVGEFLRTYAPMQQEGIVHNAARKGGGNGS